MRFNLNFIREFLDLKEPAEKIAHLLTMAGMEVEHLEKIDNDWIFDIEVTTNRYDWLSIIGIAREISAILNKKLKIKYPKIIKKPLIKNREIIIEDYNDCNFYIGRVIRNVKVKKSNEFFYKNILNCGINSVNNIVDITNYCMLKWGNPLHAFDEDKLEGNIYIRRARKKENFIGIDNREYVLTEENLVIADEKKVIALAGIIGGKNTEVRDDTKNIFLEAAVFSPITIRHSRKLLGLNTESSYRFERKVFPDYLQFASSEASLLMEKLGGGVFVGYKENSKKFQPPKKKIIINVSSLNSYLGKNFSNYQVKSILNRLDFKVNTSGKKLVVFPPKFRFDIEREVDIYEEVIRLYGYDKVEPKIPFILKSPDIKSMYEFKNELRNLLVSLGFFEIITYSIQAQKDLEKLKESNFIKLINPLREEENALRSTLLLAMLDIVRYNLNRNKKDLRLFEIANVYFKDNNRIYEKPMLAITNIGDYQDFFYLKGIVEEILKYLSFKFYFKEQSFVNFNNALAIFKDDKFIGFLGKLDKNIADEFDLKTNLFFAYLDVELLKNFRANQYYKKFSIYPAIWHDISIGLSKEIKFSDIESIIRDKGKYIVDIKVVDIYKGKDLEKNINFFTLRVFYQSKDRTLTSQEVGLIHNSIREELSKQHGVILR